MGYRQPPRDNGYPSPHSPFAGAPGFSRSTPHLRSQSPSNTYRSEKSTNSAAAYSSLFASALHNLEQDSDLGDYSGSGTLTPTEFGVRRGEVHGRAKTGDGKKEGKPKKQGFFRSLGFGSSKHSAPSPTHLPSPPTSPLPSLSSSIESRDTASAIGVGYAGNGGRTWPVVDAGGRTPPSRGPPEELYRLEPPNRMDRERRTSQGSGREGRSVVVEGGKAARLLGLDARAAPGAGLNKAERLLGVQDGAEAMYPQGMGSSASSIASSKRDGQGSLHSFEESSPPPLPRFAPQPPHPRPAERRPSPRFQYAAPPPSAALPPPPPPLPPHFPTAYQYSSSSTHNPPPSPIHSLAPSTNSWRSSEGKPDRLAWNAPINLAEAALEELEQQEMRRTRKTPSAPFMSMSSNSTSHNEAARRTPKTRAPFPGLEALPEIPISTWSSSSGMVAHAGVGPSSSRRPSGPESFPLPPGPPPTSRPHRSNTMVSSASSGTRRVQRGNALNALEGRLTVPPPTRRPGGKGASAPPPTTSSKSASRVSRPFLDWGDDDDDIIMDPPAPPLPTPLPHFASHPFGPGPTGALPSIPQPHHPPQHRNPIPSSTSTNDSFPYFFSLPPMPPPSRHPPSFPASIHPTHPASPTHSRPSRRTSEAPSQWTMSEAGSYQDRDDGASGFSVPLFHHGPQSQPHPFAMAPSVASNSRQSSVRSFASGGGGDAGSLRSVDEVGLAVEAFPTPPLGLGGAGGGAGSGGGGGGWGTGKKLSRRESQAIQQGSFLSVR